MSSAPQNALQSDSQPITATINVRKQRKSNKSPAVKAAVLVQRANGAQKSQIAKQLDIARGTVDAIIEEANLDVQLQSGVLQSVTLIPEAIRVAKHRLSQNSENMAIKVLENTIWPLEHNPGNRGLGHDTLLQVAITNLIQPATSNGGSAQSVQAETTPIPQVVDITPVSKS
jgi:hypothetical protein